MADSPRIAPTIALALVIALAGACGRAAPEPDPTAPAAAPPAAKPRAAENDYDDPAVALPDLGAPEQSLGYVDAGDVRVKVSQVGAWRASDAPEAVRDHFAGGRATRGFVTARISVDMHDGAVRGWIGDDAATGTVRAKLYRTDQGWYSGQVFGPDPLPDDARCWIECEMADGGRRQFFVALPR